MNQKLFLSVTLLFFLCSAIVLFWTNERALDPNLEKSWWIIAFTEPDRTDSLSFFIENHTSTSNFQYILKTPESILVDQEIIVPPGTTSTFPIHLKESEDKPITLSVTHDGITRTLYR